MSNTPSTNPTHTLRRPSITILGAAAVAAEAPPATIAPSSQGGNHPSSHAGADASSSSSDGASLEALLGIFSPTRPVDTPIGPGSELDIFSPTRPLMTPPFSHGHAGGFGLKRAVSEETVSSAALASSSSTSPPPPVAPPMISTNAAASSSSSSSSSSMISPIRPPHGSFLPRKSSSSYEYWHPSDWKDLTIDFLESITQHLTLRDLVRAAQSCRAWSILATEDVTAREYILSVSSLQLLKKLTSSALRRHMQSVRVSNKYKFTAQELLLLKNNLNNLDSLDCTFQCDENTMETEVEFPHVTQLIILIDLTKKPQPAQQQQQAEQIQQQEAEMTSEKKWHTLRHLMLAIGRIPNLKKLHLGIQSQDHNLDRIIFDTRERESVFAPLTALSETLTLLSFLGLQFDQRHGWTQRHLDVFRALRNLKHLSVGGIWSHEELEYLTLPLGLNVVDGVIPSAADIERRRGLPDSIVFPQLESFQLYGTRVTQTHATMLSYLSGQMNIFQPFSLQLEDASFLDKFSQLEVATLHFEAPLATIPTLIQALSKCKKLHTLGLKHDEMTSEDMVSLLKGLPLIRVLTLSTMQWLTSLEWVMRVPHLKQTLEELELLGLMSLPNNTIEMEHLFSLKALRKLKMKYCRFQEFNPEILKEFNPENKRLFRKEQLPNLVKFKWNSGRRALEE